MDPFLSGSFASVTRELGCHFPEHGIFTVRHIVGTHNANEACQHNAGQWLTWLRASPGMAIRVHYGDAVRHACLSPSKTCLTHALLSHPVRHHALLVPY